MVVEILSDILFLPQFLGKKSVLVGIAAFLKPGYF
jgi:hypothetical protein